jgi:hypothetical protein
MKKSVEQRFELDSPTDHTFLLFAKSAPATAY